MTRLLIFLLYITLSCTTKGQSNYTQAIQQGDYAYNKEQYKIAMNKYFAAEAFDPSKKEEVKAKVNRAFDAIEALRKKAEDAVKIAEQEKQKATKARDELFKSIKERASELVHFAWTDLERTGEKATVDYADCQTYLESGFRYLYCRVKGVVSFEKAQSIAGLKIFLPGGPHDKKLDLHAKQFGHYNPEFLKWLNDYIIPQGMDDSRFNLVTQAVYKTHIGPVARALYNSHEILFANPQAYRNFEQRFTTVKKEYLSIRRSEARFDGNPIAFETIRKSYSLAVTQEKQGGDGSDTDIGEKFRWLSDYLATDKKDDWYLANTSGGFWVRRSIDGTEAQIFQLLKKLLKTFEPEILVAR